MKTRLVVSFACLIVGAIMLSLIYHMQLTQESSGILANLGTGFIGTAFTVGIVDWLYERREAAAILPKRIVAHDDVRLLAARVMTFWYSAYMEAVPGELPKTVFELFDNIATKKILDNLDMGAMANVTPRQTWWDFLPSQLRELRSLAEMILHRHSEILDPQAYLLVNELAHKAMNPDYSIFIRHSDQERSYPRPQILGAHIILTDDYFPSALELIKWCNAEADKLMKMSKLEVSKIELSLNGNRPDGIPPCMIDPVLLSTQIAALQEFQRQGELG